MIDPTRYLLAICDPGMDLADYAREFRFFEAFSCFLVADVGLGVLAMVVYGAVAISVQLTTGSVMIPVVLLLLTGGATFTVIAAPGLSLGAIALLLVGPGIITLVLYAYSR